MQMHVVSNTGAYGNHGFAVLNHACGECFGVYRCDNKKIDAFAVYTNTVPAAPFAATACRKPISPSNRRWTNWRAGSASTRSNFANATWCSPAIR